MTAPLSVARLPPRRRRRLGLVVLVVLFSSGAAAVDVTRLLRRLALPTALGLALLFGLGAAGGWLGVLQFLHRTPFGVTDPVFGRDVGYYVFTVPVIAGAI